ncbi:MAG: PAS domain-containing protein [Deltaproteobacteria bacterium]|jgi:iron only hydrogenase large subunit-like protein|nr:PAS domain-containing protein [Deltaproteobacteria bacterium]
MPKEYLKLKQVNCKHCYRCIRNCPVKAISFAHEQAHIVEDECILCGRCFVNCPQNAKEIRNDLPDAKRLIASGVPVYASVAPSFVANYPGTTIESMEKALKALGFAGAGETARGATQIKKLYDEMVNEGTQQVIIASCCHSLTMLLQRYYPQALPYLAKLASPMQAHCQELKKQYPSCHTVFIGPCVSKKAEIAQYPGAVDVVLTFEELSNWLTEADVKLEPGVDSRDEGKARFFPVPGGILRSMDCANPDYDYISVDGIDNCIKAIKGIVSGNLSKCFVEMSICTGSCIGGPIIGKAHHYPIRDHIAVASYAGKRDFSVDMPPIEELTRQFSASPCLRVNISDSAIREVLAKIGKTKPEHELNCGSCGYNSCREKAEAVILGKAELEMCLPFLKEKAESFSESIFNNTPNGIIVLNESLVVQQLNQAACDILNLRNKEALLGSQIVRVLDPDVFVEVIQSKKNIYDRRVCLVEYKRYVQQTVLFDANYRIFILIMRDVTKDETTREQNDAMRRKTAAITSEVIAKQMRVVQEIASLLGETTAETKIALTRLKESLQLE